MFDWLRKALIIRRVAAVGVDRRVRYREEEPTERFILIIQLMIIFFAGLIGLEMVHMVIMGSWNDVIFNGVMLVVGTIVGAIWGRNQS